MANTLHLKTNLDCKACIAAVKPYLDAEPSIERWDVDIANPEKTLTVHGDSISMETIQAAVTRAGFQVLGEITTPPVRLAADAAIADASDRTTYYPLLLLATFLVGLVLLLLTLAYTQVVPSVEAREIKERKTASKSVSRWVCNAYGSAGGWHTVTGSPRPTKAGALASVLKDCRSSLFACRTTGCWPRP